MNIHILSDTPRSCSAYSKIVRNLSNGLSLLGHNITITGFISNFEMYNGIPVMPLATPFTSAQNQFKNNLKSSKAEALICIHEAHKNRNEFSHMLSPCYFWVPVEGKESPFHMINDLNHPSIREVVSMSYVGQEELESNGLACQVIYPGYDPEVFNSSRTLHCKYSIGMYQKTAKINTLVSRGCFDCTGIKEGCRYFEAERIMINLDNEEQDLPIYTIEEIKDSRGVEFVIGCVAQNIGTRKKIERLIEAFSKMENRKECLLHLHTLPVSLMSAMDLRKVAKIFNVSDQVMFSYGMNPVDGISDQGMNYLYNYFDIHATATGFEGFGLPILESMAAGKAQVVPACGTGPELLGENERGLLVSIDRIETEEYLQRGIVSIENLADKLDALFISKFLRNKMGSDAKEWAEQFTWDKVTAKWNEILAKGNENGKIKSKLMVTT